MRNSATLAIQGEQLPPELSSALEGGEAGAVYAVRIEKLSAEDAAWFLEARTRVQDGLADIAAGNLVDEDEAFAILEAKFGNI